MIRPDEITAFMESSSTACIEITYEGDNRKVLIKHYEGEIIGVIPKQGAPGITFQISAALSHPECGVSYSESESEYIVAITERHQIWSVIKIALSHLNWVQEALLCTKIIYK